MIFQQKLRPCFTMKTVYLCCISITRLHNSSRLLWNHSFLKPSCQVEVFGNSLHWFEIMHANKSPQQLLVFYICARWTMVTMVGSRWLFVLHMLFNICNQTDLIGPNKRSCIQHFAITVFILETEASAFMYVLFKYKKMCSDLAWKEQEIQKALLLQHFYN